MPTKRRHTGLVLAAATALVLAGCGAESAPDSPETSPGTDGPSNPPPPDPTVSEPASWPDTVEEVSSGVIRISTIDCAGGSAAGSGFLIDDDLIVTNAHVVEGAAHLTVGGTAVPAEIVGYSEEADLALLQANELIDGHVFSWVEEQPRVGDDIAVMGYPRGKEFNFTRGVVSSLEPTGDIFRDTVQYIQTDATVNLGNSGGPLVAQDGQVAAVVFAKLADADGLVEGTAYAISVADAEPLVQKWVDSPEPQSLDQCQTNPAVPDPVNNSEVAVEVTSMHENAGAIAQSLALHGNSINMAMYDVAFDLFTPAMQDRMEGLQTWQEGVYTSFWQALRIEDVSGTGGELEAQAWLMTEQQSEFGPDGQTCSIWPMDYTMVLEEGTGIWLIDEADLRSEPESCSG